MDYLIDTTVWVRANQDRVRDHLSALASIDAVWTCRAVDLEVLYSSNARSVPLVADHRAHMLDVPITPDIMDRSVDIAVELARAGLHRHAKPIDLVIAAAAESAGLTVLHYDGDYDHISAVTGQPAKWIAPADSLD